MLTRKAPGDDGPVTKYVCRPGRRGARLARREVPLDAGPTRVYVGSSNVEAASDIWPGGRGGPERFPARRHEMRRGIVLGVLLTIGALSMAVAAYQQPAPKVVTVD